MALVNLSFPLRQKLITRTDNRPNRKFANGLADYITIHETANTSVGADAEAHANWAYNSAPYSWHLTVDDREAWQHLALDEQGWHAGDGANGPGNVTALAIELCVNADADFEKVRRNGAELTAWLRSQGHGRKGIVQHNRWSGKDCPAIIRRNGLWDAFLADVARFEGGGEVTRTEYEDLVLAFLAGSEEKDAAGKVKPRDERLKVALWRVKQIAEGQEQSIGDRARSAITLVKNHIDNHGASPEIAGLKKDLANHHHDHQHDVEVKFK